MIHVAVTSSYYKSPQEKQQEVFTTRENNIVHPLTLPLAMHPQATHDGGGGEYWYEKHVTFHMHIEYAIGTTASNKYKPIVC